MRKNKKTIKEKITINVGETIIDEKYGDTEIFDTNDKTRKTYFSNSQMWVNKYRPKTLHDIIGHDEIKKTLLISIEKGDLPHLMFYGGSGTGKTSTVTALIGHLYGDNNLTETVLELNASDENGINVVRDKIIKFAGMSLNEALKVKFKIIILDEADAMTSEAQTALKKVMETTCDITRFIIICNYENKIIDAIKSRCASFKFNPINENLMIDKLKNIAKKENIIINEKAYKAITKICGGDARRSINTLQNLKYLPKFKEKKEITENEVYDITSFVPPSFIDNIWQKLIKSSMCDLRDETLKIINTSYPIGYLLLCIKDKIIDDDIFKDKQKAILINYLGKVERMIVSGSDAFIQLYALLSYINAISKNIMVVEPVIF
jgi:replication factor C subunit 2/4